MTYEQFVKQQRIRNVQLMSENHSVQRQQAKQTDAEISMSINALDNIQQDILRELQASDPALANQLVTLIEEAKTEGDKAFVKEMSRNDRRFKPQEFDFSDLYGDNGSSITNHKFF